MRKIPKKNYIIVLFIFLFTVTLILNLMNIYNSRENKLDFITEVKEDDLDYYIAENNDTLIYMTDNKKSKEINKKFKEYLKNKEIDIIYIDLNDVSNKFDDNFTNKYIPVTASYKFFVKDPTIVSIENGYIEEHLTNIKDFKQIKNFIEGIDIK